MRAFCLGCLLAIFGCGHHLPTPIVEALSHGLTKGARQPVYWWVADRAGGRIVGFDAQLFPQWVLGVTCPLGVARAGTGLWVVNAPSCAAHGGSVWTRIVAGVVRDQPLDAGEFAGLCGLPDGGVLGLVGPSPARALVHLDEHGALIRTEMFPGATHLAQVDGRVLVANRAGELWTFGLTEGLSSARHAQLNRVPRALAPGPDAGWWWLGDGGELLLLGPELNVRWSRWVGPRAALLAGDEERVWVVPDDRGAAVAWGAGGRSLASFTMPSMGAQAAQLTRAGGLLVVFPGALLEVDESGHVLRSQAGVDHLVDLSEPGA